MKKLFIIFIAIATFSCQQGVDNQEEAPQREKQLEDGSYDPNLDDYDPTIKRSLTAFIGEPMPTYPENGTIAGRKIEEVCGVSIDFSFLSGELSSVANGYLNSDQLPDLINMRKHQNDLKTKGKFIPLNNLIIKYAPNLKRVIGDYWNALKEEDGNIYIIPDLIPYGESTYTNVDKGWWIQKIILKEAGWPKVKKFEEYWKLIGDYKKKYPTINGEETIGFLPLTYDWYKDYLFGAAPLLEGKYSDNPIVDKVNGKWAVSALDKSEIDYKYIKFLNGQFNKGLIHKEGFNQDLVQHKSLVSTGRVLGIYDEYWIMNSCQKILKENDPERIFVGLPLTWDGGSDQYFYAESIATGLGTSISTSCKDPVAAIKFLDTLVRDDITALLTWGVEGVSYSEGADGKFNMTPQQIEKMEETGDWFYPEFGGKYFYEYFPSANGTMDNGNPTRFRTQGSVFKQSLADSELEILDAYNWGDFTDEFSQADNERAFYSPLWSLATKEGSNTGEVLKTIDNLREEYFPKSVMAKPEEFENIWQEWSGKITSEDIEIKENFFQEGVDKRLASYGVDNQ